MEKCASHEYVEKQMEKYHDNQQEIVKSQQDLRERLSTVEASSKSAHHRLDGLDRHTEAIIKMSVNVEKLADEVGKSNAINSKMHEEHAIRHDKLRNELKEEIDGKFEALDERLGVVETLPGKVALKYIGIGFGAAVTLVVGFLLFTFTNGKIGG